MLGEWFKKEMPLLGMLGMGGGIGSNLAGGGAEVTGGTLVEDGNTKYHVFM